MSRLDLPFSSSHTANDVAIRKETAKFEWNPVVPAPDTGVRMSSHELFALHFHPVSSSEAPLTKLNNEMLPLIELIRIRLNRSFPTADRCHLILHSLSAFHVRR